MSRRVALIGNQADSLLNFRSELIQEWINRGHAVFTFAPDWDDHTRSAVQKLGAKAVDYPLNRTGMNLLEDWRNMRQLSQQLKGLRIDCSLAYFIKPVIFGTLAARRAGVKTRFAMIEGAGYVFADTPDAQTLKRRFLRRGVITLYRHALQYADRVFFLNQEDQVLFVHHRMSTPAKSLVIGPIGVNLQYFTQQPLTAGPPTFVMVARLIAAKGVAEFAQAAGEIKKQTPNARFILLGERDNTPESLPAETLRTWTAQYGLEWPGKVTDVRPWLAQASVCVLPSYYREGVPRSLQEAAACGRAIITTTVPGCKDTVIPGQTGLLIPPRDVPALVGAMRQLIQSPALCHQMGQNARVFAQTHFDATKINHTLSETMGL